MIEITARGRARVLTLARPPVNAMDDAMIAAIDGALDRLAEDSEWTVLHLRSDQKAFCAGADLALLRGWMSAADPTREMTPYLERFQALYRRIETLPQVVFAEIGGAAMGGGLELALACDLRIAAHEARLGLPEAGIGLLPAVGGTQRLTRLCGPGIASRLILGCETVDGAAALGLRLVEWAVPRAQLADEARAIVDRVAALPASALQAAKLCIHAHGVAGVDGFALERRLGAQLIGTVDSRERVTAFLDHSAAAR